MGMFNELSQDGSFKFTKLGDSIKETIKIIDLMKEEVKKTYNKPHLLIFIDDLLIALELCKLTGHIPSYLIMLVYMPPANSNLKLNDLPENYEIIYHLPKRFQSKKDLK